MGRKRWRERRAAGRITTRMFDVPSPARRFVEAINEGQRRVEGLTTAEAVDRVNEAQAALRSAGFSFDPWQPGVVSEVEPTPTGRLLCGADLGDGPCRKPAGHVESADPACSTLTVEQERAETERSLNAGTPERDGWTPDVVLIDEWGTFAHPGPAALDDLPAVSNPAPGLWEIVTGEPLPSYAELVERGHRAEHPTYDLLNVQSTRAPELSSAQACDRLAAALERPRLAARVTEVLPPALVSQLALAVEEAVRRGIAAHIAQEKATLDQMADAATQRLQQSIEDQKRGREANAERWTTPSRLS